MLTGHLCAMRCNTPLSSVKVDLGPLSCAQLPGTNEYQGASLNAASTE